MIRRPYPGMLCYFTFFSNNPKPFIVQEVFDDATCIISPTICISKTFNMKIKISCIKEFNSNVMDTNQDISGIKWENVGKTRKSLSEGDLIFINNQTHFKTPHDFIFIVKKCPKNPQTTKIINLFGKPSWTIICAEELSKIDESSWSMVLAV